MKKNYRSVPIRFAPDIRLTPVINPQSRAAAGKRFEQLKNQLLWQRLESVSEDKDNLFVHRAASEAAALAWLTAYPLLVFPALFQEKAEAALAQAERQAEILDRSRDLLCV